MNPDNQTALDNLPPLRDVIARHGLAARKSLGQNFLLDENLLDRIARAAGPLNDAHVVEVGPGPGGLTRALLRAGARRVTAIEKDRRAIAALDELAALAGGRLTIMEGDALGTPLSGLADQPLTVVANLPFNIATPLLMSWLEAAEPIASMTLMFQREVAARLTAKPRTKDYGRLAVAAQWRCLVKRCFDVPPRAFVPQPKVAASVVHLDVMAAPVFPADSRCLAAIVKAAFGQRRKALRNALGALVDDPLSLLETADIDPGRRAEELEIEEFARLARAYEAIAHKPIGADG